jgi:hypothetical protein
LATISVCADTGLLPGPHCHHVVREHFAPSALPHETCRAHDEHGAVALAPRYAEWVARARPASVVVASPAHRAAPRVAYPRDGSTLLVSTESAPEITLRATADGEAADARFEIDGHALHTAQWPMVRGHHVVVAMLDGRRSEPTEFDVVAR